MYLSGLTHRDQLFDLIERALNDNWKEEDSRAITEIFMYERFIYGLFVIPKLIRLLGDIYSDKLNVERIFEKDSLRDSLISYVPDFTQRIEEIEMSYRKNPEQYFPHIPINAILITTQRKRLVSIGRLKRLSRVAEKVSHIIADSLYKTIKTDARKIAELRIRKAGLPRTATSSPGMMLDDFVKAESITADRFLNKTMSFDRKALAMNDMFGFKVIGKKKELDKIKESLVTSPDMKILKIREHTGNYQDVNLLVEYELPNINIMENFFLGIDWWSVAPSYGISVREAEIGFTDYLQQGSRKVCIEIILTSYEELMESEFGRSMHELRILKNRDKVQYNGEIAHNVKYIIEYLLTLAISPISDVSEIPIKITGRYLPETVQVLKCAFFGNNTEEKLLNAFCLIPECTDNFCLPTPDEAFIPRRARMI